MHLTIEFLGLARELAGQSEGVVALPDSATWRDLFCGLAQQFPALVGPVIVPDSCSLTDAYMLNIDGRTIVRQLDEPVQTGRRLLLMFAEAGG
ncbi:MAG: MoaD/ThiS family protein [Anaerolineae bacterium]|nr:MoaD/ThiS family protein [Chloroflexota bacterium]